MPSGPHDKKGQDKDRTGGSPPAHVPQRTLYLDIFSEAPVEQATLEELLAADAAVAARPEGIALDEWILTGRREFLLRAFQTDYLAASRVIEDLAWSNDPRWAAIAPMLPSLLASLLEEQGQAAEGQTPVAPPAPEPKPFVRPYLAKTLLGIAQDPQTKSKALDFLLSEAVALGDPGRDVVRRALSSFEPLEVMPNLIRFLREARARGHAAWQVFFDGIDRLIEPGFRAYEDRPADAERFRGEILPLFAELLTDGRLDDWVKEQVVRIVRIGATPLGGGLKAVVAKLGKFSGVAAEGVARRIYDAVLRGPESDRENREAAAEWATEHPSKVELSSSLKLTSPPSLEKTIPVSCMDAPQQVSPGPAAALSPDLDLSSRQVTTENGIHALDLATLPPVQRTHVDQGSQGFTQHVVDASAASSTSPALEPSTDLIVGMIWKTFRDLAAHRPEAIPAILEGSRSFSADFGADGSLAAPVAAANAPEPPVGPLQVPNNSQGSPKTRETNFMSTSEAAEVLKISEGMVRRHCESGKIEGEKLGRDWIVIRESVERFRKNPPKRGRKPKASAE